MKFQFLGTSSGTPTRQRNVSGLALNSDNSKKWYLVDCGEGTQHQVLNTHYSLHNLEAIFITHVHGDHCYGLPGLLASIALSGRQQSLTIIAPQAIEKLIECVKVTTQLNLSYPINFLAVEHLTQGWHGSNSLVTRIELSHRVPSFAFRFSETNQQNKLNITKLQEDHIPTGPLWGKLQRGEDVVVNDQLLLAKDYLLPSDAPQCIIVAGDNDTPERLADACQGADVLIHESTYTQATLETIQFNPQHCSAKNIAIFAEKMRLPSLVLTHFSPRYQTGIQEIETEAKAHYSGTLFLARDFDQFWLRNRMLTID